MRARNNVSVLSAVAILASAGYVYISQTAPALAVTYAWDPPSVGGETMGYLVERMVTDLETEETFTLVDTIMVPLPLWECEPIGGSESRIRVAAFNFTYEMIGDPPVAVPTGEFTQGPWSPPSPPLVNPNPPGPVSNLRILLGVE